MNPSATDDRTEAFARLLQELLDRRPGTSGEWLARLVAEIRPRGRDGVPAAREHLRLLIRVVQARPESAAALSAHLGAQLTSRMHRILYADSGMLPTRASARASRVAYSAACCRPRPTPTTCAA